MKQNTKEQKHDNQWVNDNFLGVTKNGKRFLVDWFTSTFDKIKYIKKGDQIIIDKSSVPYFEELLQVLTADRKWDEYDKEWAKNNYKTSIVIGEFIRVQLFGPKNSKGNRTTMVELSGKACREFLNRGGSWINLIELLIRWNANFTRVDAAIDDFTGEECNIYDIKPYIENYDYTSCFKTWNIQHGGNRSLKKSSGFTIYIGSSGSTQLCIYDKKLEREKDGESVHAPVWFRYEMRLKQDKAKTFVEDYLIEVLKNNNEEFGEVLSSMLYGMLDIKIRGNDSNMSRWDTVPFWLDFLQTTKTIDLAKQKEPTSIDRKRDWISRSAAKALAQLYLVDGSKMFLEQIKLIGNKMKELKDKDLESVNKFLRENDMDEITKKDLSDISRSLLTDFDDDEEE